MKIHRAVLIFLCVELAQAAFSQLATAQETLSRNGEGQQLEANAQAGQSTNLLGIMQSLQQRMHPAAVASEVQVERRAGQSAHERQLLSDMGRLESQLESWKAAEESLESQVAKQAATVEAMKAGQAKAIHDEQVAAVVWWDCKMLMCCALMVSLAFCVYTGKEDGLRKPGFAIAEPAEQPVRKGRAQTEFVEKDVKEEAEDILVVTLPHVDIEAPDACKQADIAENVWHLPSLQPLPDETTPEPSPRSDSSKCQYFNMAEEYHPPQKTSDSDAWWNDSAGGY